ncbi:unnamed protein product [Lactuca saligna]|uniref:Uncharacterized protein n=1 Tax=Lactuca saligna TaxID=75948 RepID=A0AA35ZLE1_LACSI|nr:unnamed protein product [Lactuca saligna]
MRKTPSLLSSGSESTILVPRILSLIGVSHQTQPNTTFLCHFLSSQAKRATTVDCGSSSTSPCHSDHKLAPHCLVSRRARLKRKETKAVKLPLQVRNHPPLSKPISPPTTALTIGMPPYRQLPPETTWRSFPLVKTFGTGKQTQGSFHRRLLPPNVATGHRHRQPPSSSPFSADSAITGNINRPDHSF